MNNERIVSPVIALCRFFGLLTRQCRNLFALTRLAKTCILALAVGGRREGFKEIWKVGGMAEYTFMVDTCLYTCPVVKNRYGRSFDGEFTTLP